LEPLRLQWTISWQGRNKSSAVDMNYRCPLPTTVIAGVPAIDTTALQVAAIVRRLRAG
jgi:hypothetical protein